MTKAKDKASRSSGGKGSGKLDFGRAYAELEEIVAWFEGDDLDLDDSLVKFERGLELASACQEKLKDVENKVSKIRQRFDGLV